MSQFVELADRELSKLAVLGESIMANPAKAAEKIELARKIWREHTPQYLGVVAVIETVCVNENGSPSREDVIREGLELTEEESIFRVAGTTLAWAGERWLNRRASLTEEEQLLVDQITLWRENELARTVS